MTNIKTFEVAVIALPPGDFAEFDSARWGREIEQDVAAGKIDALLAEAQADQLTR